jgi:hypothetical protein
MPDSTNAKSCSLANAPQPVARPAQPSGWVARVRAAIGNPFKKVSAWQAGLLMGGGAAFIQAYLKIIPPPAYGICFVCHPKDLLNWVFDHVLGTNFGNVTVSVEWPVLTALGTVIGAFIAAKQHGEFHLEDAREPLFHFMTGFLVINFGLILGSCPIRIIIVSAYGSLIGIVGYACMIFGIVLGSLWLRNRARKQIRERMKNL